MTQAPILEVEALRTHFFTQEGVTRAVDGVSFAISPGECVGLVGESGCGKSTFLSAVDGLVRVNGGTIKVHGKTVSAPGPDRAMVFQQDSLFPWRTVLENIEVGSHQHHPRRSDALAHARGIAQRVGIPAAMLDQPAAELTVAGRKRLELARALATEPKLLLLDEVMAGLNPQEIIEIIGVWAALESMAARLITQNATDAEIASLRRLFGG